MCFVYYMIFDNCALLYREAKALKALGFEVDVIGLRKERKEPVFGAFDGIRLYRIQARPAPEQRTSLYLCRLSLFFCKACMALSVLGVWRRYDLIHVTTPPDFMVFAAAIPKLLGARIVMDIHDIGPELFMRKLNVEERRPVIKLVKFVENISTRFADHVITVTELWRKKLIARSAHCNHCTVLLNVPDEDLFKNGAGSVGRTNGSNDFNLYYHGSLEEHFGVDTMLASIPLILPHVPNLKLYVYGAGRLANHFRQAAKDLKIEKVVTFENRVPFYQVAQILRNAHLGIVPTKSSVFSEEALSMKSMDYIALGIPIVISRTRAHNWYFDDSMVAFFEPEDPVDLARAVVSLHQSPSLRRERIANATNFIQQNGWQQQKQVYYDVVNQLLTEA